MQRQNLAIRLGGNRINGGKEEETWSNCDRSQAKLGKIFFKIIETHNYTIHQNGFLKKLPSFI